MDTLKEVKFGPIHLIPGKNRGQYPYCNSVFVEGAGLLIDPSSDRKRLLDIHRDYGVETICLSHWHEDHFRYRHLFEDLPLWMSREDAPALENIDSFMEWYGVDPESHSGLYEMLRTQVLRKFHFTPQVPGNYLAGGDVIDLGVATMEVIATPGHTPGHLAFFFREEGVLYMGDYTLMPFGPWYGDPFSGVDATERSLGKLREVPAKVWISGHNQKVFRENPGKVWDDYLSVIRTRDEKILDYLAEPRSLMELTNQWIVLKKPREPLEYYVLGEKAHMRNHLFRLVSRGDVVCVDGMYRRV